MDTTPDPTDVATAYIDAWNTTDPAQRQSAVAAVFAPGARYTDPLGDVTGTDGISGLIAAVQDQFPGARFALTGAPEGHHQHVRFSWELGPVGAEPAPVAGSDVVTCDEQGRIQRVVGFLDRVPS